ncbi:Lrp/AsnC family transcriptional regulator [Pantoea rwandensis]|uniref:AsnC family transcriptional regulator n=1 Tax=Pantoea rwandensis TaxID=1076550 RepID=A0A1X1D3L6_9GAMM|nr:Lrp/AsnC family transcriptional regulator [Pantoea rwandensis]ORM71170.1 AsnC family transcriptional regulator [Pantoea rwandensis]
MDSRDRLIIAELQKDGRLTNQELAERVNLSPSPCLRRLKNLEEQKMITGYTAIIDEKAYGLGVTAFVRIRLISHSREIVDEFEKAIGLLDEVMECYLMTGSDDYLLKILVEELSSYEGFVRKKLHSVPGIASLDTSFAYGMVKRNLTFPNIHKNR